MCITHITCTWFKLYETSDDCKTDCVYLGGHISKPSAYLERFTEVMDGNENGYGFDGYIHLWLTYGKYINYYKLFLSFG